MSKKIINQWQVNKIGEIGNYITVSLQDDVFLLVGDIHASRMTHDEKEKQSEFIADFKLKPSTLYEKAAEKESQSLNSGYGTGTGKSLKSSKIIIKKYHIMQFSSVTCSKSKRITKIIYGHYQKAVCQ